MGDMKRTSVTIPDDLEQALEEYQADLEVSPALSAVVQSALREYLEGRGYLHYDGGEPPPKPRGLPRGKRPVIDGPDNVARAVIEGRR